MNDAKEKREARRRRILENSEKRLERIAQAKYNDDSENTKKSAQTTGRLLPERYEVRETTLLEDLPHRDTYDNERFSDTMDTLDECTAISKARTTSSNKNLEIWRRLGFKLVVLAIIVRIVHTFKLGYLFGETIVLPFALFMMTQLGSCQFEQNTAGITGPILYFIGMSPTRIKNLLICYNVVSSILIYFGIYFFTFVCTHLTFVKVLGL